MKNLKPLAATIAILLASTAANAAENNAFAINGVNAAGTPTFVSGQLGSTTAANTVETLKSVISSQSAYQANGNEDFSVTDQWTDQLGKQHTRVSQTINGLNVYGSSMIVHANIAVNQNSVVSNPSAEVYAISGNLAVNAESANTLLKRAGSAKAASAAAQLGEIQGEPELAYVYLPELGLTKLVYKIEVSWDNGADFGRDFLFYDAKTAALVTRHAQVHTAKNWKTHTLNGGSANSAPGTLVCTNTQSCGGNAAAQRAHDGASKVYDYYKSKFSRSSLNNADLQLVSSVEMGESNAYWTGSQMIYGQAGGGLNDFTSDFDVIGHELTHGVTQYTANLIYNNASGALNEAWSDIMGLSAEAYKNGTTSSTWLLGDGLYNTPGKAFRYMNNPTKDGYSKDWWPERIPYSSNPNNQNDQGGVHGNSGIANLAYTLLVDGGTHPRGKSSAQVPGIGLAKAEQIFYRALSTYMSQSTNFAGARTATENAARDLYSDAEIKAVGTAWCAVGVGECPGIIIPPPPPSGTVLTNGVATAVPAVSTGQDIVYTLVVPKGANNISFTTAGGTGDADMYVKFGSTPTDSSYDCRPYANGNSETCTGTQAEGTYYVRLKAYASFSGVSLTGSFSTDTTIPDGDCPVAGWSANTVYLGGSQASYAGNIYQAKWYSIGESPATNSGQWDVWSLVGACK